MNVEIDKYIRDNFSKKTDYEIGKALGYSEYTIKNYRLSIKIRRRFDNQKLGKDKISKILEGFANYTSIKQIAKDVGVSYNHARYVIDKYFFYTKSSYNTLTMVMDSKMNYN